MGVIGLWSILDAGARPVRLEALAKKRLAVDASIWIYQFLKAVRDKEGNVLKNAHVVGFFRRICKLLFHGIQPIFVFDGKAPLLKRQTLRNRKVLREGGRVDVAKTAGKILAVQMRKRALEEAERQKRNENTVVNEEAPVPENPVYFEEIQALSSELQKKKFKKADEYHLPEMDTDLSRAGGMHDPRIMTHEELQAYAREFEGGEDMSLYDFTKIDYDSEMFTSLPPADQYSILNAARLRSRLRMGLSTEQLTDMFPDRMAFSRFQIERVKERSDLTNRLMNLNGMNDVGVTQRIASERGKEYILVKNETADGGWSLGIVNNAEKPIMIDIEPKSAVVEEQDDEDDMQFEDVPLELQAADDNTESRALTAEEMIKYALEESRRAQMSSTKSEADFRPTSRRQNSARSSHQRTDKTTPLFARDDSLQEARLDPSADNEARKVEANYTRDEGQAWAEEEAEELRQAVALSMESNTATQGRADGGFILEDDEDLDLSLPSGSLVDARTTKCQDQSTRMPDFDVDFNSSLLNGTNITEPGSHPGAEYRVLKPNDRPAKPFEKLQKAMQTSLETERVDLESTASEEVVKAAKFGQGIAQPTQSTRPVPTWFNDAVEIPQPPSPAAAGDETPQTPARIISDDTAILDLTRDDIDDIDKEPTAEPGLELPTEASRKTYEPQNPVVHEMIDEGDSPGLDGKSIIPLVDQEPDSPAWSDKEEQADVALLHTGEGMTAEPHINAANSVPEMSHEESQLDEADQTRLGEEEDMLVRMAAEEHEYARFSAALSNKTTDNYNDTDYEQDLKALKNQQKKNLRDADEVTQLMVLECQELLAQFGIPYLTAASEAESQCAKLVQLNLVDGIVTDDSDVFLFGGTRVYRNMFNAAKTVECYVLTDLEREFDLDREKLIRLAHLLGSDYTEGIKKIGPVLALELIAEFTGYNALRDFKEYVDRVQSDRETEEDKNSPFRKKFKKTAEKLVLPDNFPNPLVREAYINPEVDADTSSFEWGQPDVDALRSYLMRQCGWHQEYTDSQLLPVIKDMNVSGAQPDSESIDY